MKVKIRKRIFGKEKSSLYLDYTQHGKRIKEALNLYLFTHPKNKTEEFENKKTNELAERLSAEKLIELQDHQFGTHRTDHGDKNFIEYFAEKMEDRRESVGNYGNWDAVLKHLKKCYGEKLKMSQVNIETCNKFKVFLTNGARTKSTLPLSQNSKYSYLNKFKACLKIAYKERMISENVSEFITGFKQGESNREYLTFEEVQKLAETDCQYPVLKNAFLFSCLCVVKLI